MRMVGRLILPFQLGAQIGQGNHATVTVGCAQRDALVEDVAGDHLLLAQRRRQDLPLFREFASTQHVELMLVAQAAHQPTAGPGDLLRIERQLLIFGDAEIDRTQVGEPRRRAVLASAASHARESLGFVAHADLLELDPGAEQRGEIAHQAAKVDATFGGKVDREFAPVPLPFDIGELHHQMVGLHAVDRLAAHFLVLDGQRTVELLVGCGGEAQRGPRRWRRPAAMGTTVAADLG